MLRKLLEPNIADVRWMLSAMDSLDGRRPMLLIDVLARASKQQLCAIFEQLDILEDVRRAIEELPAATEILARIVENVPLTVFAGEGEAVLTSQIFPDHAAPRLSLFSEGANAEVTDLKVWTLSSIWTVPK